MVDYVAKAIISRGIVTQKISARCSHVRQTYITTLDNMTSLFSATFKEEAIPLFGKQ